MLLNKKHSCELFIWLYLLTVSTAFRVVVYSASQYRYRVHDEGRFSQDCMPEVFSMSKWNGYQVNAE